MAEALNKRLRRWPSLVLVTGLAALGLLVLLLSVGQDSQEKPEVGGNPPGHVETPAGEKPQTQEPAKPRRATQTRNESPLWLPVDESQVADLPLWPAEWSAEGRALVTVSGIASTSKSWTVGDRLTLPVPQLGETYRPVIEEIDEAVGSRAFLGWIDDDDGHRGRYVVTIGPNSLFAYIDTPDGPYELMADHRSGWLLPASSMMAGWDFSKSDILPERP